MAIQLEPHPELLLQPFVLLGIQSLEFVEYFYIFSCNSIILFARLSSCPARSSFRPLVVQNIAQLMMIAPRTEPMASRPPGGIMMER